MAHRQKKSKRLPSKGNSALVRGSRRPRWPMVALVLAVGLGAVVYLYVRGMNDAPRNSGPETKPSSIGSSAGVDGLQQVIGRWRRPDGGYILEIRSVDAKGNLAAAYYNPRPIQVSRAEGSVSDDGLKIFIELRDVGYPGATYALRYDPEKNLLAGYYHQPAVGGTFDVIFKRVE